MREDAPLLLGRRVLDHDVEHEAIELRLRQRIGAFLLDRVLRGQHEERPVERVRTPVTVTWYSCIASSSAACVLGGVRLISSARMMFAKIGPRMKRITRLPVARSSSITSAPEDVGRHQIGRELDAVEPQVDRLGQLLDQQRLGETGHAAQQAVPAGEKRDQDFADDPLLPDDGLGQLPLEPAGHLGHAFDRNRRRAPVG